MVLRVSIALLRSQLKPPSGVGCVLLHASVMTRVTAAAAAATAAITITAGHPAGRDSASSRIVSTCHKTTTSGATTAAAVFQR